MGFRLGFGGGCAPCCGPPATGEIIRLSGMPAISSAWPTTGYDDRNMYLDQTGNLGYTTLSDWSGTYPLTPGLGFLSHSYPASRYQSGEWWLSVQEQGRPDVKPKLEFGFHHRWFEAITKSLTADGNWPRNVVLRGEYDFTLYDSLASKVVDATGMEIFIGSGSASSCASNEIFEWGTAASMDCCRNLTGTIPIPPWQTTTKRNQYDDELLCEVPSGATVTHDLMMDFAPEFSTRTTWLIDGATYALKATGGYSPIYESSSPLIPIPGWYYQGTATYETRYISTGDLRSTGTRYFFLLVTAPAVYSVWETNGTILNTDQSSTFVFGVGEGVGANHTNSFRPFGARFPQQTTRDACRAWVTKTISDVALRTPPMIGHDVQYGHLNAPGITVRQG